MAGSYKIERGGDKNGIDVRKTAVYLACYLPLLFISAVIQITGLSFFGSVPALTFSLVCAIGFISGGRLGAVAGMFGGLFVDLLGGTGISFSPVLYMLCGYLCGALVGWFLSKNLPSFTVFAAIAGFAKEIYTLVCCGLLSESFSLTQIITKILITEYFAYLLCVVPSYGAVLGLDTLIKGKDKKRKAGFR